MTSPSTSLYNYHPIAAPKSVTLANGSLPEVVGSGTTHLSPNVELLSILHVPVFLLICYLLVKLSKPLIVLLVFTLLCVFFRISR